MDGSIQKPCVLDPKMLSPLPHSVPHSRALGIVANIIPVLHDQHASAVLQVFPSGPKQWRQITTQRVKHFRPMLLERLQINASTVGAYRLGHQLSSDERKHKLGSGCLQ